MRASFRTVLPIQASQSIINVTVVGLYVIPDASRGNSMARSMRSCNNLTKQTLFVTRGASLDNILPQCELSPRKIFRHNLLHIAFGPRPHQTSSGLHVNALLWKGLPNFRSSGYGLRGELRHTLPQH